jgi:hypothetical protein
MYISERKSIVPEVNIFDRLATQQLLIILLLLRYFGFSILRMNMLLQYWI